jgi:branched-chain amino acid transport system permease protein
MNQTGRKVLFISILVLLSLALPFIFKSMLVQHFLVLIGIKIILVMSLDLVVGHTGLTSLGHAGFMGIGAYTCSLLVINHDAPFLFALLSGMLLACLFGILVGYPSLRLKGHYFVIVTFICGIIFNLFFTNLIGITKGPMGIPGIPPPQIGFGSLFSIRFESKQAYYYLVIAFIFIMIYVKSRFYNSKMGRALEAIRGDEDLAKSLGINAHFYKVTAFATSTGFAGLAGGLYAHYFRFIGPDSFTMLNSFDLFVMNLVGGVGTIAGPIIGPLILTVIDELSQLFKPQLARILFGVSLILIILYMPKGIMGLINERRIAKVT